MRLPYLVALTWIMVAALFVVFAHAPQAMKPKPVKEACLKNSGTGHALDPFTAICGDE
jgi:hypothetical protein